MYMEEEMNEDKPILMWALRFNDHLEPALYASRTLARYYRQFYDSQPSVVRVQITVLKDRK